MNKDFLNYIEKMKNSIIQCLFIGRGLTAAKLKIALSQDGAEILSMLKSLVEDGFVEKCDIDGKTEYYLTKNGVFRYAYNYNPDLINKSYDIFREYDVDMSYVDLFLANKFYYMYLNDEEFCFDNIVDEFNDFAIDNGYITHRLKKQ